MIGSFNKLYWVNHEMALASMLPSRYHIVFYTRTVLNFSATRQNHFAPGEATV